MNWKAAGKVLRQGVDCAWFLAVAILAWHYATHAVKDKDWGLLFVTSALCMAFQIVEALTSRKEAS